MKRLKKFMSILLTAIMVLAMCVPVMATDTYTITAPAGSHQYEIYQIFTGDLSEGKLSNIKWGKNGTGKTGDAVDETTLNALKAVNSTSDRAALNVIESYVSLSNPVATITNGATYSAAAGYYLIKDKDGTVSGTDAYTTYIVKVVGDTTITPKSDVPSFEKKLKDTNDTTGTTSEWQDSADYDIGDEIPFKLEGTVASNYGDYKHYYFAFHDKEERGLSFNENTVKAYAGTYEIPKNYYSVVIPGSEDSDSCTFEVVFNDLKEIKNNNQEVVTAGMKIRVEYTSTLTSNANLGNQGNVNSAQLEFSNNPNSDQGGKPDDTGKTPWDNVIVFTYKVVVNKYANSVAEENRLAGAEFTLEKILKDGTKKNIAVTKFNENKSFEFKGLDDGQYVLTESTTPEGYNTINPITFTVTADHDIIWTDQVRSDVLTSLSGNVPSGEISFTAITENNKYTGELSTDVINKSGSELPSTGGIGTTIFYVVGVILMLGAGVLLVTKKRMSSNR